MGYSMPMFFIQTLRTAFVAVLCAPMLALGAESADLETLFYTPSQRLDINRGRQGLGAAVNAATARLNGVVRRAGGKSTVWINDQPYAEGSTQAAPLKGVDAVVQGQRLRVGESIDKASGERTDVVAPGAVTVRSKP